MLQHDEQAVLCAVELALDAGVATKTHVLNILHRLIDAGLIAMERRNIRIINTPRLASYCE